MPHRKRIDTFRGLKIGKYVKIEASMLASIVIYLTMVVGTILCWVPVENLHRKNVSEECDASSPIRATIDSPVFTISLVVSMSAVLPIAFDLFLDTVEWAEDFRTLTKRWMLTLVPLLFGLVAYVEVKRVGNIQALWSMLSCRDLIVHCVMLEYFQRSGSPIWTPSRSVIATVLVCTTFILRERSGGMFLHGNIYECLSLALKTVGLIMFALGFKHHYNESLSRAISAQNYCIFTYSFWVMVIEFSFFALYFIFGSKRICDMSPWFLASYTYLHTLLTVMVGMLHSRRSKIEAATTKHSLELKRIFVRYVSHEIRTPLNTVSTGLNLMQSLKDKASSMTRKELMSLLENIFDMADEMKDSCDIAVNILNDLLLYEKLEGGIATLEKKIFSTDVVVRDAVQSFSIQAREAGIRFTATCDDALCNFSAFDTDSIDSFEDEVVLEKKRPNPSAATPKQISIDVDKPKISQVLRNLVSNALKFTPRGGFVRIHASLNDKPNAKRKASLSSLYYPITSRAKSQSVKEELNEAAAIKELNTQSNESVSGTDDKTTPTTTSPVSQSPSSLSPSLHPELGFASSSVNPGTTEIGPVPSLDTLEVRSQRSRSEWSDVCPAESSVSPPYVRIEVQDSGVGLSFENQAKLFKQIIQFSAGKLQGGQGSGLGLYISRGIMDLHGGGIGVYSEGEGHGSTFFIDIPVCTSVEGAEDATAASADVDENYMNNPKTSANTPAVRSHSHSGLSSAHHSSIPFSSAEKGKGKDDGGRYTPTPPEKGKQAGQQQPQQPQGQGQGQSQRIAIPPLPHVNSDGRYVSTEPPPDPLDNSGRGSGSSHRPHSHQSHHSSSVGLRKRRWSNDGTVSHKHSMTSIIAQDNDSTARSHTTSSSMSTSTATTTAYLSASSTSVDESTTTLAGPGGGLILRNPTDSSQGPSTARSEISVFSELTCFSTKGASDLLHGPYNNGGGAASPSSRRHFFPSERDSLKSASSESTSVLSSVHSDVFVKPPPPETIQVLIVDDSTTNRKMLGRLLKLNSICEEPTEAEDGRQAVEMVEKLMNEEKLKKIIAASVPVLDASGNAVARVVTNTDDILEGMHAALDGHDDSDDDGDGEGGSGERHSSPTIVRAGAGVQGVDRDRRADRSRRQHTRFDAAAMGQQVEGEGDSEEEDKEVQRGARSPGTGTGTRARSECLMDEFSGGPDAILMDYVMPRLSGPDATKELRERGFNGMIIGVTGNALPEDIEHFKSKGADAVLTKPIDTEELKRLLAHSRGIRSKRTSNRLNSKK